MKSVAFIGSAGIPNRYGGFESFLEACAPIIAEERHVVVTCDSNRYDDLSPYWSGVERQFIKISANGAASIIHDLVAYLSVFRRVDTVVILGVSAGILMPLIRILGDFWGKRVIVNLDGIEWRREKFSAGKRAYLWLADRMAQRFAHRVIVDNRRLLPFLSASGKKKVTDIAYSGDQTQRVKKRIGVHYCLTICRIEPENNCEMLIQGFLDSDIPEYRFVGNWNASPYARRLRDKYQNNSRIKFIEPIYDSCAIADLRESTIAYLHGHSVGGTNPSLVEMLYYDAPIFAFDCDFNIETAGESALYFKSSLDISELIRSSLQNYNANRVDARGRYTRAMIVAQYKDIIDG